MKTYYVTVYYWYTPVAPTVVGGWWDQNYSIVAESKEEVEIKIEKDRLKQESYGGYKIKIEGITYKDKFDKNSSRL